MNGYWNTGNTPRNILIIPCPMTKVNVKLQSNESWTMTGSYHFGIKFWDILSDKEPDQQRCLLRQKEVKNR